MRKYEPSTSEQRHLKEMRDSGRGGGVGGGGAAKTGGGGAGGKGGGGGGGGKGGGGVGGAGGPRTTIQRKMEACQALWNTPQVQKKNSNNK